MRKFIKLYIAGCAECQQYKINRHPTKPTLMPIEGPKSTRPFSQIAADFITDLPESEGFDSILVVVDHGLMKGVILEPCTKKSPLKAQPTYYSDESFPDLDYPTNSSPIEAHNLQLERSKTYADYLESNQRCPQPTTHRPMEEQNESTKRSKHTFPPTAPPTPTPGPKPYRSWSLPITPEPMLIAPPLHSN